MDAMTARKKRTGIEWVGGLVSMPAYVTGEGEPYRPEALFWMGAEGAVLGHAVGKPGELVGLACESLRSLGRYAEPLGVSDNLGSRALADYAARWAIDEDLLHSAEDASADLVASTHSSNGCATPLPQ